MADKDKAADAKSDQQKAAEQAAREGRGVAPTNSGEVGDATPDQASDSQAAYEAGLQAADPKNAARAETTDASAWDRAADLPPGGGQRASESGDPSVHQLLAEAQTARQNGNHERAAAVDQRLRDAGYEVG